jgi:hypothetical protein
LVSWWRAEGNALDEIGANDGTATGIAYGSGEVGHADALAGFDSVLEREELPSLDEMQDLFQVLWQGSVMGGHRVFPKSGLMSWVSRRRGSGCPS